MKKVFIIFMLVISLISFSKDITVWTAYGESTVEFSVLKEIGSSFEEQTGIKVNWVSLPDLTDLDSKLRIAAPAGFGPDLLATVPHDSIGKWAKQRIIRPIDDTLGNIFDLFTESSLMAVQFEGKTFGLPFTLESVGLVYNKAFVKEAPENWDEIVKISQDMIKNGKNGIVFPAAEAYHMYSILRGFGGYIFKWEDNQYNISEIGMNNEGTFEAISFLKDLFDKGILPNVLMDHSSMHSFSTGVFEEGNAAFQINGPWVLPGLQKAGIEYGVAPIPMLPNGDMPKPFMGVQIIAFNNYSKKQNEAIQFAKFLTSHENMLNFALKTSRVASRKSVINSSEIKNDEIISGWSQQAVYGEPMPNIPEMSVVWTAWKDSLPIMYSGRQPIQATLDELVNVLSRRLDLMKQ